MTRVVPLLGLAAMGLLTAACATSGTSASGPLAPANDEGPPPVALEELSYRAVEAGFSEKLRFERDEPRVLVGGDPTRYRAFELPVSPRPLKIKVETFASFEVPHYPVKYLFCPRIVLLDADFEIVHRSTYGDLKTTQRVFGEPRFELEHLLGRGSEARFLLVVREPAFDGQQVESIHEDPAGQRDSLNRTEREKIQSSRTGPGRLTLEALER